MPNVHLTQPMETYVKGRIKSGAYANVSEVVRAGPPGIRLLMQRPDGARQFYAMKSESRRRTRPKPLRAWPAVDLERAVRDAEAGHYDDFDPQAYEPDAYRTIAPGTNHDDRFRAPPMGLSRLAKSGPG